MITFAGKSKEMNRQIDLFLPNANPEAAQDIAQQLQSVAAVRAISQTTIENLPSSERKGEKPQDHSSMT